MGRIKVPPIPWVNFERRPPAPVTGSTNPMIPRPTPLSQAASIPKPVPSKLSVVEQPLKIESSASASLEKAKETPSSSGATECPHCNMDFKDMAVADIRSHVESCSRPTTAGSDSASDGISEAAESPLKRSGDQILEDELGDDVEDDESDDEDVFEDASEPDIPEGMRDYDEADLQDLPGPFADDDEEEDENEEPTILGRRYRPLIDSNDLLQTLENPESMTPEEFYRRTANVANVLDTLQLEWMQLEKITAKYSAGDGVPAIRDPRVPREEVSYQDRLGADVHGYNHNPHPNSLGRQDPIAQRAISNSDELRSRLRKQTKKAFEADNESDQNLGENGRPIRTRYTPVPFDSQSREQTPVVGRKPRGRGRGGRVDELRAEHDARRSPLRKPASWSGQPRASSGDSEPNSRPSSSGSSHSGQPAQNKGRGGKGAGGRKRGGKSGKTSDTDRQSRKQTMTEVEPGVFKSRQSVLMTERWAKYRENPEGPRIGRKRRSEIDADQADQADQAGKYRKLSRDETNEDVVERVAQTPGRSKRGGRRAGSGRKPSRGANKSRGQRANDGSLTDDDGENLASGDEEEEDGHLSQTPPPNNEERLEPSSGSTRASTRQRKPSMAKIEADDGNAALTQPTKKPRGQWGGRREKGKHNDGTPIIKSKPTKSQAASTNRKPTGVGADPAENAHEHHPEDEEYGDEDSNLLPKKNTKRYKNSVDDYPDLPVYDKHNPSPEYMALPKHLKMKAVSRARWANGGMGHMFGQKGPNKVTKEKYANMTASNSARTSVSGASARRQRQEDEDDEELEDIKPPNLKRKTTEYEEYQELASPLNHSDRATRKKRRAFSQARGKFEEQNTSPEIEDEEDTGDVDNADAAARVAYGHTRKVSSTSQIGRLKSREGPGKGGRPRIAPIRTDVANSAIERGPRSGNGTPKATLYEEFLALGNPNSPVVLPKRGTQAASSADAERAPKSSGDGTPRTLYEQYQELGKPNSPALGKRRLKKPTASSADVDRVPRSSEGTPRPTVYEQYLELSNPNSPMVLGKRKPRIRRTISGASEYMDFEEYEPEEETAFNGVKAEMGGD